MINKDIVLFGIQGSGKGTQGKILAEKFNMPYFEMGGELRKLAQENSELGKKVKSIIDAGRLVPTNVVMEILANYLNKLPRDKTAVIDGIPRNQEQASGFDGIMEKLKRPFIGIHIELSEKAALERLTKRRICSKCKTIFAADYEKDICACGGELIKRTDDNEESIRIRFDTFRRETMPIINHYLKESKMISVNGDGTPDEVTQLIMTSDLT